MNNNVDEQYFELLNKILSYGIYKSDRTNVGTISIFGYMMRFNMSEGFPILTSKKVYFKGVVHELLWFLNGDTNIKYLIDNKVNIWNGDAYKNYIKKTSDNGFENIQYNQSEFVNKIKNDEEFSKKWGDLGPIYGKQWRRWNDSIDQLKNLIHELKTNPDSRRLLVSSWNVGELDKMVLPPCHFAFQCYTKPIGLYERKKIAQKTYNFNFYDFNNLNNKKLDELNIPDRKLCLQWYQRSVDVMLGLPFNISSYALLLSLIAKEVNMIPDELIFIGGDVHIYYKHIKYAKEQLTKKTYELPQLILKNDSIFNVKYEDIILVDYKNSGELKMELFN